MTPEIEQMLLSGMVFYPELIPEVADLVSGADFALGDHARIFDAMVARNTRGDVVDLALLETELFPGGAGAAVLLEISSKWVAGTDNVLAYARSVSDGGVRRRVQPKAKSVLAGLETGLELNLVAGLAEEVALACSSRKFGKDLRPVRDFLAESFRALELRGSGEIVGLKSGIPTIDRHTHGFMGGDLIVLGGRPRMGKTALAGQIALYNAVVEGKSVAFFEEEMTGRAVVDRMLVAEAAISASDFRKGNVSGQDVKARLLEASKRIAASKLMVDESTGITPLSLLSKCRKMKARQGLDLVVVDNIQRMRGTNNHKGDKRKEAAEVSEALKNLAKDLNIPVIAISHLSRECDRREDKRPMLADLQESGNIEQDADIVMFLYREAAYKDVPDVDKPLTELFFAKYRDGEEGMVKLHFSTRSVTFTAWSDRDDFVERENKR